MTSFLDELEAEREIVLANEFFEVPVPPSGRFVIRCRPPLDTDRVDAVTLAYRTRGALSTDEVLQLFVDVCDEILRVNPDTGKLEQYEGGPFRFDDSDERWGEDVDSARACVAKLFNLDKKPLAAAGSADRVVDWLQTVVTVVQKRVEGKSDVAEGS